MKIKSLRIAGFRAFNDEQTVELDGKLVIYWGATGTGKTSIGEALEWLFYGKTLKRVKGDEISKREYAESYRNAHFTAAGRPFVEALVVDAASTNRVLRRELNDDESSALTVDGNTATDLTTLGIGTPYDRPLILQHTLQDFIFMKPKTRYEILSSMLGLECLLGFRSAVEQAKTEFSKRLPTNVQAAQATCTTLKRSLQAEPLLAPVASAITRGNLAAARKQLVAIALGRVAAGTTESDLVPALQAAKAAKERGQLDWGRFSLAPLTAPSPHLTITEVVALSEILNRFQEQVGEAANNAGETVSSADPRHQEFLRLGLALADPVQRSRCPFCLESTLSPERLARLKEAAGNVPQVNTTLNAAIASLKELQRGVVRHGAAVARLLPVVPSESEQTKITELGSSASANVDAYLQTCASVREKTHNSGTLRATLEQTIQLLIDGLGAGDVDGRVVMLESDFNAYAREINSLPATANAYAATYAALDPYIKSRLGSVADVQLIRVLIDALEQWQSVGLAQDAEDVSKIFPDLVRQTRQFIEKKQKEILGVRDQEIKRWYDMMNPGADVGYQQMVPGTDSLELQARSFAKIIMAAPNLSTCQLNCLGLSIYLACATRPASPHQMLLIDDPIQSMDDDHIETFKMVVLKELLDRGFQVIVLTHMDNFADDLEKRYRASANAVLYRFEGYTKSGPSIASAGPEILRLLGDIRRNKDSTNEGFRKQANIDLRKFVERFTKDAYSAETGKPVSKAYEDTRWAELKKLLRHCKKFDSADEPILEGTHDFTSKHLHTDATAAVKVPSSAHLNPHYTAMKNLLEKYKSLLDIA
ncbi:MAG: hypothetical protein C5B51_28100 [Terriglobia bacterium]|nr:MAG: hypothetical protein C5B51_28100 [Terriglobia bacterium]